MYVNKLALSIYEPGMSFAEFCEKYNDIQERKTTTLRTYYQSVKKSFSNDLRISKAVAEMDMTSDVIKLGNFYLAKHLDTNNWTFEASHRLTSVLGRCCYPDLSTGGKGRIIISMYWAQKVDREELIDTILHEIAHALVGPGHDHDEVWQDAAVLVGARPEPTVTLDPSIPDFHRYVVIIKHSDCHYEPVVHSIKEPNIKATSYIQSKPWTQGKLWIIKADHHRAGLYDEAYRFK